MKTLILLLSMGLALGAAVNLKDPTPTEIETIIKRFAQKESDFSRARQNYIYRQITKMNEMDPSRKKVIGKYETTSDWVFVDGKRTEIGRAHV